MPISQDDDAPVPGHRNYLVYCDESGTGGSVYYGFGSLRRSESFDAVRLCMETRLPPARTPRVANRYDRRWAAPSSGRGSGLPAVEVLTAEDIEYVLFPLVGPMSDIRLIPSCEPHVLLWSATDHTGAAVTGTALLRVRTDGITIQREVELGVDFPSESLVRVRDREGGAQ